LRNNNPVHGEYLDFGVAHLRAALRVFRPYFYIGFWSTLFLRCDANAGADD
jgi:hypothetical protein